MADGSQGLILLPLTGPYEAFLIVNGILCLFAIVALVLRILSRKLNKSNLHLDDWLVISVAPLAIAMIFLEWFYGKLGLGESTFQEYLPDATVMTTVSVVYECVYIWSLYLSRLSILVFYLSLFHLSRFASIAVKTCIALTSIVAVTFLFIDIFICHPINTVSIKCDANRALVGSVLSGLSVLFDIVVLNIPIIAIWKMRLSQSRKISLVVIFSSGLLVTFASLCRLITILTIERNSEHDWWIPMPITSTEVHLALLTACLPRIRPVLAKLMPSVLGDTPRSCVQLGSDDAAARNLHFLHVDQFGNLVHLDLNDRFPEVHDAGSHRRQMPLPSIPPVSEDTSTVSQSSVHIVEKNAL